LGPGQIQLTSRLSSFIGMQRESNMGEELMCKTVVAMLCGLLMGGIVDAQKAGQKEMKPTSKTMGDFNLSNRFSVEIDGVLVAGVHAIKDLDALLEQARAGQANPSQVITHKDGEDGVNRARPGNHKPGKIVLTKDWSNTLEWYQWRKKVLDGKTDRRSVSIIFHDDTGKEVRRMIFYNCWPTKHVMPTPNDQKSRHATETIELEFERLELRGK
jgi:phage tail-like protein